MVFDISEYSVLEIICSSELEGEVWNNWVKKLAEMLTSVTIDSPIYFFTMGVDKKKSSIIHEMGDVSRGSFNSKPYLICYSEKLSFKMACEVIESDEFYLGRMILIKGTLNEKELQWLIIHWENELVRAGIECFKMDNDGSCINWYNPSSMKNAKGMVEKYLF